MNSRMLLLILLASAGWTVPLSAQELGFKLGVGPGYAGELGVGALAALEIGHNSLLARADARVLGTGNPRNWDGPAQVFAFGGGAGIAGRRTTTGVRPYGLATISAGQDFREADRFTSFGLAAGFDTARRVGLFGELRYEYWRQVDRLHHDLPSNAITAVLGVAVR